MLGFRNQALFIAALYVFMHDERNFLAIYF